MAERIIVGADPCGIMIKEEVKKYLQDTGYEVTDVGSMPDGTEVDYYEVGARVGARVSSGEFKRGFLFCGTGMGVSIVANKFQGVYCGLCESVETAKLCRTINNCNVLAIGGFLIGGFKAVEMAKAFLETAFTENFSAAPPEFLRKAYQCIGEIETNLYNQNTRQGENETVELMLNCEDPKILGKYFDLYPIIDGVTTNPLMISRAGKVDFFDYIRRLRLAAGERKLMAQVTSSDCQTMVQEAELIRQAGGDGMFVKIPAIEEGIRAMEILSKKGYNITATVVGSFGQGMAALKAGAKYVAVFYGPMESKGMNPCAVIKRLAAYIQASGCEGRILAAGCKDLEACGKAMKAGATAFTVDTETLTKGMTSPVTKEYAANFKKAWEGVHGIGVNITDLKK